MYRESNDEIWRPSKKPPSPLLTARLTEYAIPLLLFVRLLLQGGKGRLKQRLPCLRICAHRRCGIHLGLLPFHYLSLRLCSSNPRPRISQSVKVFSVRPLRVRTYEPAVARVCSRGRKIDLAATNIDLPHVLRARTSIKWPGKQIWCILVPQKRTNAPWFHEVLSFHGWISY